ncbi:MAG: hypothetical protein DELT_02581 [Desulfovibrio sp.]
MTFLEAREALHQGAKIRHESMPEGEYIMMYRRGFGDDTPIFVDENENLSDKYVDFIYLFHSTLWEGDDGWTVQP